MSRLSGPHRPSFPMRMIASPRRFCALILAALLAALLPARGAFAYDRNLLVSQYQHTAWLAKDGAPAAIHAIAQTDDGTLWLGAEDGLYRFDGQAFERVPTPSGPSTGKPYVYALVAQPGGTLWVGFRRGGGIGLYKDGKFTRLPATLTHEVNFMAVDSHGTLWAQMEYDLYRVKDMKADRMGADWNVPAHLDTFAMDRADAVWVTDFDQRLYRLAPGDTRFVRYADSFPVTSITVDLQGGLWGSNAQRSSNVEARDGHLQGIRHGISGNFLGTMLFDRDGGLWVQHSRGLSREPDPAMALDERLDREPASTVFSAAQGLSSETIYAMVEDRDGNVWAGTSKGLDRFRRTPLTPVRLPGRALSFAMAPASGHGVWAVNWAGTLMKVTDSRLQDFPSLGPGLKLIRTDSKGGVWIGGGAGLWHSKDGSRFENIPVDQAFVADSLRAIEVDGNGGFWVSGGGPGRLAHVVDGRWTDAGPSAGFPTGGSPRCLVKDDQQRIWACQGTDPFLIVGDTAHKLSSMAPGLDIGMVSTIHLRGDHVWLGGYTGLALFDGKRVVKIRRRDGRPFSEIGGIVELESGDVWLHDRTSAIRIPAPEVKAVLAGARNAVDVETLDETDGLYGTLSASSPLPSLVQGDDGRLWFATDAGLAWLDPAHREKEIPAPAVHVRALVADGRSYDVGERPELTPRNKRVELSYAATALTMPERVRFRYRLDGIDSDWQDVGARRTAWFNDLPPGDYTFRVKSTDEYGRWDDREARIEFRVAAAWFQTLWFRSLLAALAVLAAWLLHRWRAHHLLRLAEDRHQLQMRTRTAERDRIARDLHDTVLQGTTGLVLNLQVAINRLDLGEADRQRVQELLDGADRTVDEARTRVSGLRAGLDATGTFADSLRGIGEPLADQAGIAFELLPAPRDWDFDPQVRDHLVLIAREALVNAGKHAHATRIVVRLTEQQDDRIVQVIDDGTGFAVAEASSAAQASGHWGLHGMRERAAEIGARFDVRSRPGQGTEITVVLPTRRPPVRWGRRS
jgi:signal transduction histidine kinase/ligand-binding sensor domain-containing protein